MEDKIEFSVFWDAYDKKVGSKKSKEKWNKLDLEIQMKILKHVELYKEAQPDKQFRKDPYSYLYNETYYDEIIDRRRNATINQGPTFREYSDIVNDISGEFAN